MTISIDVRNKIIELHLGGKKRQEITDNLNLSGIRVSTGSISNIIAEWRQHENLQALHAGREPRLTKFRQTCTLQPDSNNMQQSLQSNMNNMTPHSSEVQQKSISSNDIIKINAEPPLLLVRHGSGTGQAVSTTNTNSNSNIVIPRDGGPLSHLLGEDTLTDEEEVIPPVTSYSNLPSSVPPTLSMGLYPNTNIPSNFHISIPIRIIPILKSRNLKLRNHPNPNLNLNINNITMITMTVITMIKRS